MTESRGSGKFTGNGRTGAHESRKVTSSGGAGNTGVAESRECPRKDVRASLDHVFVWLGSTMADGSDRRIRGLCEANSLVSPCFPNAHENVP